MHSPENPLANRSYERYGEHSVAEPRLELGTLAYETNEIPLSTHSAISVSKVNTINYTMQ